MARSKLFATFIFALTMALFSAALAPDVDAQKVKPPKPPKRSGMVYVASDQSFDDTVDALQATIEANPNLRLALIVNHQAAARSVGLELDPNTVMVFGNPAIGTPLMQQNQVAGIDLPQKLHVIETDGQVFVGFNDATYLEARHGLDGQPGLDTIAGALRAITASATGPDAPSATKGADKFRNKDRLITVASDADFDTTMMRLRGAIDAGPASVIAIFDHQQNAATVGLELRPTTVLYFGSPAIGTPIMQEEPTVGIDLPLKMLVWEDDTGQVFVTTNDISLARAKHKVKKTDLSGVAAALDNLLAAATGG